MIATSTESRDSLRADSTGASGGLPSKPGNANIGTFHALKYSNYRFLWLGNWFTSAAMWIQQTTIGWVVYDLTDSGSLLGAVNSVRGLPTLVVSPIAGVLSDRMSPRRIISISQFLLFLITLLLAAGLAFDRVEIWHVFVFVILMGIGNSFNMPARQVLVFDVVPREVISNAVALSNLAFSTARTVGPMVGGALIVTLGVSNNFLVQSLAYLGVMITVLLMKVPAKASPIKKRPFFRDLFDGYAYAAKNSRVRLLVLMMAINPLFLIPLHLALLPIFTKDVLDSQASGLGILLASIGAGGLIGALFTASLNRVDRRGLLQMFALFIYTLSQAAFSIVAFLTGSLWASIWFLVLAGASESVYQTTNQTVLQLGVPPEMRGRITSIMQVTPLLMSVSLFVTGVAADLSNAPLIGTIISLLGFGCALAIFVFSPQMRNLRLSQLVAGKG